MFKRFLAVSVTSYTCLICVAVSPAFSQSIEITSPVKSLLYSEGDDYASTVLNNAWDMNNQRDIGWEESFDGKSVRIENGIWKGTYNNTGGYLFPLFPGFKDSLFPEPLEGDKSMPKLGIRSPIDARKYTQLSFRMKHSSRSLVAVYWNTDTSVNYWPNGKQFGAKSDEIYHGNIPYPHSNEDYLIYNFDMKNLKQEFQQTAGEWKGNIFALRLDPSVGGPAGSQFELDWVRLVNPASAGQISISWASTDLPNKRMIKVFVDNDSSGFDGTLLKHFPDSTDPGVYSFSSAILPPGKYHFYVESYEYGTGTQKGILLSTVRSNYSAAVQINASPSAWFESPSRMSGVDYAKSELGNPWDMSSGADVDNLVGSGWNDEWRQFTSPQFKKGVFQALADRPLPGRKETDAQVHLKIDPNKPILTSKYRYLSYKLAIDPTNFPTISDKIKYGWVARPVFWDLALFGDGGSSKAHAVYEGNNTYTLDLWDPKIIEAGRHWLMNRKISHLRIDPLETDIPTWFYIDSVKLTAENRSTGKYELRFKVEDNDKQKTRVRLYYDKDNRGFNGKLIKEIKNLKPGSYRYKWDTSKLPTGVEVFVYLKIDDGINVRGRYAPVSIKTGAFAPPSEPLDAPNDYDGDHKTDMVVYRQSTGGVFHNFQSTVGAVEVKWGGKAYFPVEGNFDGDAKSDYTVVTESGGYIHWFSYRSIDNTLYKRAWGVPGDVLVPADYNGDGQHEIAIFRPGEGTWYAVTLNDTTIVKQWGTAGDIPVPGDYDGDQKDDFAIWRPTTGEWWISKSSKKPSDAGSHVVIQWGKAGDIPVVGDFDGDRKVDQAVFRPSDGFWYIRKSSNGKSETLQWGANGDIPKVGDYNGDGISDPAVWRPSTGTWHVNLRNGTTIDRAWGSNGDLLP